MESDESSARHGPKKWKIIALMVLTAIVAGGAGYGIGRLQGWLALEDVEEARATAEGRVAQLEARRQLALAQEAAEDANEGVALQHVAAARQALAASLNADDDEISTLVGHLEAVEAGGGDRNTIPRLARRLDELQSDAAAQP